MAYSKKLIDHYENPRNVGSMDKESKEVGTGLVGAPACGDVMKLQIKVNDSGVIEDAKFKTFGCGSAISSDLEVSRTKALLNAKVNVADIVGSSILKSEKQSRSETIKGIKSTYKTTEENKILETSLNNYQVVLTKTFKQGNQFRTYTVIKYENKS